MINPQFNKKKPWKFINNYKKIFMPIEKVVQYSRNNSWIIVDTRTLMEYNEKHIENSIHVNWLSLKKFILSKKPKTKMVLIARNERTYVNLVSWARAMKYKNIYLLKGGSTSKINTKYF